MRPCCWIDFETGGLDSAVHSPLSFGMLATMGDEIFGEWYVQIRQEPLVVTAGALKINKIDITMPGLSYAEFKYEYFARINQWFYGGSDAASQPVNKPGALNMPFFCGQNTFFDRPFLQKILGSNYDGIYYHRKDLMVLANALSDAKVIKFENMKLETIAKTLGIEPEGELHNAIVDIKLTFKCWNRLIEMLAKK